MAKGRTEIAELGEFGLIDRLTAKFSNKNSSTICGVGDDAAVIEASKDKAVVISTDSMLEGIDFDLTYFPPKHLGYKAVTKGISDVVAMNAVPEQITLSLRLSIPLFFLREQALKFGREVYSTSVKVIDLPIRIISIFLFQITEVSHFFGHLLYCKRVDFAIQVF